MTTPTTWPSRKIWMDSGAFTAFTKGEVISLDAYCQWLHQNGRYISHAAVLDDITDPAKSWANQQAMEANGLKPVPCFHYGEDPKWLVRYLDRYDYIALGGMVPIETAQLLYWLDDLFRRYICDGAGYPITRIHGFGLTTFELMERYPWFSVDSSAWLKTAHFGSILMLSGNAIGRIAISGKSARQEEKGQHFLTESPANMEAIRLYCASMGFEMQHLIDHYQIRDDFNAMTFKLYEKAWQFKPYTPTPGLFDAYDAGDGAAACKKPGLQWEGLEVFLAGEVDLEVEMNLIKRGSHRMFSYHYVNRPNKRWELAKAVLDGRPLPKIPRCTEKTK